MKSLALVVLVAAAPAWAQSTRYPPQPPDKDREAARTSHVWESALHPGSSEYEQLVRDAKRMLDMGTPQDTSAALDKLALAIHTLPAEPDAYVLRGHVYLTQRAWTKCADDLTAADDRTADGDEHLRQRLELGICQARAGRLAEAERTLIRASATAQMMRSELALRLGEVRIAMGKLDEAIDALSAALEYNDGQIPLMHWLLAAAYDRARRPADARFHAERAVEYDRSFSTIEAPLYPLIGAGEHDYLMGLANELAQPRAEYALLYFRRFLRLATDSPWRRRAEEHVRELVATGLPQGFDHSGTATLDTDATLAALRKGMPALRGCMAKLPATAMEVSITRLGPRSPESRDRPIYRPPPAGHSVLPSLNVDAASKTDLDDAQRCLDPLVERLALPAAKDRDTYYRLKFYVVQ